MQHYLLGGCLNQVHNDEVVIILRRRNLSRDRIGTEFLRNHGGSFFVFFVLYHTGIIISNVHLKMWTLMPCTVTTQKLNIMPAHSPSQAKPGGGQAGGGLLAAFRGFSS